MNSVETVLQILNFNLSLASDMHSMILSHDAGQWQPATAWAQPHHHKGKQLILYSAFIVLGDFAQLANVSVLSMLKID